MSGLRDGVALVLTLPSDLLIIVWVVLAVDRSILWLLKEGREATLVSRDFEVTFDFQ